MANKTKNSGRKEKYDSRLLIYPARRWSLASTCFIFGLIMASLIATNLFNEQHWLAIAIPLLVLGSLLVIIPPTEEWQYQAWQTKTEQIERHFLD